MPLAAPANPRKILPPPITMQIWVPASAASFTSRAMRSTVSMSMPKPPAPIKASPETLSRTRRYFGAVGMSRDLFLAGPCHLGDFISEIAFDLLDALAHLQADKAGDLDRRAKILGCLFDHLGDLGFAVDHEGLVH